MLSHADKFAPFGRSLSRHLYLALLAMPTSSRPSDAHCRGIRRMWPSRLSGICEQAPDAFIRLGHAWLIASRKKTAVPGHVHCLAASIVPGTTASLLI